MNHRAFCRNCGADIVIDEQICIDEFSMLGDAYPLCYRGQPIKLTHGERTVAWSLLKAYPEHVRRTTLLDRLDSESANNILQVIICRIRHKLTEVGAPNAIETVWGAGYRWKPGGGHAVAEKVSGDARGITKALRQLYSHSG